MSSMLTAGAWNIHRLDIDRGRLCARPVRVDDGGVRGQGRDCRAGAGPSQRGFSWYVLYTFIFTERQRTERAYTLWGYTCLAAVPNLDLPAICSPKFKPGPPTDEAQVLSDRLNEVLVS